MKHISVGETFGVKYSDRTNTFRRETDDPEPMFECERIRVTHVACSLAPSMKPYTFGTEPEWFKQRNLEAV